MVKGFGVVNENQEREKRFFFSCFYSPDLPLSGEIIMATFQSEEMSETNKEEISF